MNEDTHTAPSSPSQPLDRERVAKLLAPMSSDVETSDTQRDRRRIKDRERRAATRALYIAVFGSTRLLRGVERRRYNSKRRRDGQHTRFDRLEIITS